MNDFTGSQHELRSDRKFSPLLAWRNLVNRKGTSEICTQESEMYYFHPRIRPISSVFSPICEQVQVYEPCHAELSQIGNSLSQTQYRCQTLIARLFVLFVWVIFCLKKFSVHNNSDILLWTNKEYVYV